MLMWKGVRCGTVRRAFPSWEAVDVGVDRCGICPFSTSNAAAVDTRGDWCEGRIIQTRSEYWRGDRNRNGQEMQRVLKSI